MPLISPASRATAQRLLARASVSDDTGASDPAANADRMYRAMGNMLTRWFGPYGYHALLARALAETRPAHPALAAVDIKGETDPRLDGIANAAVAYGAGATVDAVTDVAASVVELLGRLIGEDMAQKVIDAVMPELRNAAGSTVDAKEQT
jgi:hypothetical protein